MKKNEELWNEANSITQYWSKWRNCWVDVKEPPTPGDILKMKEYHYLLR